MSVAARARAGECVPRLARDWEERAANLSPEEGFLLSRIDGQTSWDLLRRIGGLDAERVHECVRRWLEVGLLEMEGWEPGSGSVPPARGAAAAAVDPTLEISDSLQREILAFDRGLDRPYHELLGVSLDADARTIKRAYFALSKKFHPDRYFGKQVGPFAPVLDRIFKHVAIAYELLNDPATRTEIQRSFQQRPEPAAPSRADAAQPKEFGKREWLARMRKQFRIPEKVLAERRFKAKQLAEAARAAQHHRRWNDAASSIRLAIAFDPWADEYKAIFAQIQAEVNQLRAKQLIEEASGALDQRSRGEVLALYEEAVHYRPRDAELHVRASRAAFDLDDLERAEEYARWACELSPESAAPQLALARVLRKRGLLKEASTAVAEAARLAPGDSEVKEEQKRIRRRGRKTGGL